MSEVLHALPAIAAAVLAWAIIDALLPWEWPAALLTWERGHGLTVELRGFRRKG